MKLLVLTMVLISILLLGTNFAQAQQTTCIYFFYGSGCPHCAKADSYIQDLEKKYDLEVYRMNINEKIELLSGLYENYSVSNSERGLVPILFISDDYIIGDMPIIENIESKIKT